MHNDSLVKVCKSSPKTSKCVQCLRNNSEFGAKLRFPRLWPGFDAENVMYSVWLVMLSKSSPKTSKYLQRLRNNSEFGQNCVFLGYGLVSTLKAVSAAIGLSG
jgi:hypothetical protein